MPKPTKPKYRTAIVYSIGYDVCGDGTMYELTKTHSALDAAEMVRLTPKMYPWIRPKDIIVKVKRYRVRDVIMTYNLRKHSFDVRNRFE